MTNFEDPKSDMQQPDSHAPTAPPADVESQATGTASGFNVSGILRRWRRDDLMRKGSVTLRPIALIFSLLSFLIMASNEHGDWKDFDKYEEYRYVLAISVLSTLYTGLQSLKQLHQFRTGKHMIDQRASAMVDFFGDQGYIYGFGIIVVCGKVFTNLIAHPANIMAYFLVSSASSAVPLTNRMREGVDNIFTDSSAAAISMSFLAFLALALSAMISGYKLSTQSYI